MKSIIQIYKATLLPPYRKTDAPIIGATLFLLIGLIFTISVLNNHTNTQSQAASVNSVEPENGTLAGNVTVENDPNASGGEYVQFGNSSVPTLAPTTAIFKDFFERTDASSGAFSGAGWNQVHRHNPDSMQLRTDGAFEGSSYLRFHTHNSDKQPEWPQAPTNNPRTQLNKNTIFANGQDRCIHLAVRFPSTYVLPPSWNLFYQHHGPPYTASPPLSLFVVPTHFWDFQASETSKIALGAYGASRNLTYWIGPDVNSVRNKWIAFKLRVLTADAGSAELWMDTGSGFVKQTFNGPGGNNTQKQSWDTLAPGASAMDAILANYREANSISGYSDIDYDAFMIYQPLAETNGC